MRETRRGGPRPGGDDGLVLTADSVGRSFGPRRVLTSATLWARRGEITVLLGRNGTGKTTLLRIAAGALPAHHGTLRFRGELRPRARLHRLARGGLLYIPQEGLLPRGRTVVQAAVALARRYPAPGSPLVADRVAEWLGRWELAHLADAVREELSSGERNRASLALAVLRAPVCLLADEPLTGSAPRDRERIGEALRLLRSGGCAVVVTGHEARELLALADRVVWMVAGTTRDLGSREQALTSHQFRREYLGPGVEAGAPAAPAGSGPSPGPGGPR